MQAAKRPDEPAICAGVRAGGGNSNIHCPLHGLGHADRDRHRYHAVAPYPRREDHAGLRHHRPSYTTILYRRGHGRGGGETNLRPLESLLTWFYCTGKLPLTLVRHKQVDLGDGNTVLPLRNLGSISFFF